MTLFEEAKVKREEYIAKKEEATKVMYEAERAECKAIEEFFLVHGIRTGHSRAYKDDVTIVKIKTAHSYYGIKEGQEGILEIYPTGISRFLHFHGVAFIPLTKQKKPSTRTKYTCLSCEEVVTDAESFLEHILADFEITDKTYSDEE